jgi:hypothetical protein
MILMAATKTAIVTVMVSILLVLSLAVINSQNEALHPSQFTRPAFNEFYYQFSTNKIPAGSKSIILTIDGISYTYSQLPVTETFIAGTQHKYSFSNTIYSGNAAYTFNGVSGCGFARISSTFNSAANCALTVSYVLKR